ncbi:FAD dependent oxidoreductase [Penicillium chrysogenum]|uniref:FAD dependent oxidoreductase n=1 Tax=Penicillium chrysogenum TaxID=5076 RepID=A0ABQ8WGK6_PENCH|nr:FAD dependent oxidoreductase [Penicillium chrysogenum]KAJ5244948.1 FAD dependent oxidoreductase [Penicillium chrysogenum]KAJ5264729.1 FAD dependent oxidoreductase [Penicillium chrysogenum]KAJ5858388.1 FAD dependent oxidoreductase [Penicillium rubens]
MVDGPNSSTNHPTTATSGGASAKPTPANNAGGGSGWGDPGFVKGGTTKTADTGLGHVAARNPASTTGKFLGLEDQTGRAERKDLEHVDLAANDVEPTTTSGGQPTCATEDHSFMERKPGGPDTLPGWKAAKNILNA